MPRALTGDVIFDEMSQRISQSKPKAMPQYHRSATGPSVMLLIAFISIVCFPALKNATLPISHTAEFDDIAAIKASSVVQLPSFSIREILTTDFWGTKMWLDESNRSYRPVAVALFWVQNHLGSGSTLPFRVTNIALRALLCIMVFAWYQQLLRLAVPRDHVNTWLSCDLVALFGAALIAAHPLHVDTYHFSVGQGDTLCAILVLCAVMVRMRTLATDLGWERNSVSPIHKPWQWWRDALGPSLAFSLVCVAASTSKEIGAMISVILCFTDAILVLLPALSRKQPITAIFSSKHFARCCVLSTAWLAWMYVRLRVIQPAPPEFAHHMNVAAASPHWHVRWLTLSWAAAWHFASVLFPTSIAPDWGDTCITPISSLTDTRNCTTLSVIAITGVILRWICRNTWMSVGPAAIDRSKYPEHPVPGADHNGSRVAEAQFAGQAWQLPLVFAASVAAITFLPSSNMFFTVGFLLAERVMLLPSIGTIGVCLVLLFVCTNNASVKQKVAADSEGPRETGPPAGGSNVTSPLLQWACCLCGVFAIGVLAATSIKRQIRMHDREDFTLSWLESCPLSRKTWDFSTGFSQSNGFYWTPHAQVHQRGCNSDMGWIHDCGLQRQIHLKTAANSLVQPPTNCSRVTDASCHPLIYDITQPNPADHLLSIRDFCVRSIVAKPPPIPAHVDFDPSSRSAEVLSVPFSIMSAGERTLCAAAMGPHKHWGLFLLTNLAMAHSPNVGPEIDVLAVYRMIMDTYELEASRGRLVEFDSTSATTALTAYFQHLQYRLASTASQERGLGNDAEYQHVERTRKWLLHAGLRAPYTLLKLFGTISQVPAGQWLESVRMSASAQAVRIDGLVNPPAFLHGIVDLLVARLLIHAQRIIRARDILQERYSAAQCANVSELGPASICRFCPFIMQVTQVHMAAAQAQAGVPAASEQAQADQHFAQAANSVGLQFGCTTHA